ncbi:hypothetical protein L249_5902, partial [Ophiocordyceps polyrhachis-furcata BCC 54312]
HSRAALSISYCRLDRYSIAKVAPFFEQGEEYAYNTEHFLNYLDSISIARALPLNWLPAIRNSLMPATKQRRHFLKSYNLYLARCLSILRMRFVDIFFATSLREILLALCVTPTPKAPSIISLLFKVSNFTDLFSKEKASALLPYYSS